MRDSSISTSKLVTALLWAWVTLLFAAAWLVWALDRDSDLWMMLALTGCVSSAMAATSQIRCYSLRICGLLRATARLENEAPVRSLR